MRDSSRLDAASASRTVDLECLDALDFGKGAGLLPAIVQHADTGAVLMLGYMNREALRETLKLRRVVLYSRSRGRLWEKGETSGHTLELAAVRTDCDADALLIAARPHGPACHLGSVSCFGEEPLSAAEPLAFLATLANVIDARAAAPPQESYTARLLESGAKRLAQKVGEEGLEVALAGAAGSDAEVVAEAADLLYHLLVLIKARGLTLGRVIDELQRRHTA